MRKLRVDTTRPLFRCALGLQGVEARELARFDDELDGRCEDDADQYPQRLCRVPAGKRAVADLRQVGEPADAACGARDEEEHENRGHRHQDALDEVGPRHGVEAADHRVEADDQDDDEERQAVAQVEEFDQQRADALEHRGHVQEAREDDDQRGGEAGRPAVEAEADVVRDGHRAERLGHAAQPRRQPRPGDEGQDDRCRDDQQPGDARGVGPAGEAEEGVRACVGGEEGDAEDDAAERTAADQEVRQVARPALADQCVVNQNARVEGEQDEDQRVFTEPHVRSSALVLAWRIGRRQRPRSPAHRPIWSRYQPSKIWRQASLPSYAVGW